MKEIPFPAVAIDPRKLENTETLILRLISD